jgi:hypothetical protein
VRRNEVNLRDIAALTARNGVEYAVFTRGPQRLIIRGSRTSVNVDIARAAALYRSGHRWTVHSHPSRRDDLRKPRSSEDDRGILMEFKSQSFSAVLNSRGDHRLFDTLRDFMD